MERLSNPNFSWKRFLLREIDDIDAPDMDQHRLENLIDLASLLC